MPKETPKEVPKDVFTKEAYGVTLLELGRENEKIVVLDADLSKSTKTEYFASDKRCESRFFDCGVAEQNMMGIAAGLAASGKIVFASTFAVFATGRCFDQLRMSIAQPGLNVKIAATHSGISVGEDGCSHQSIEDIALACSLPGFNVVVPADGIETVQVIKAAVDHYGPFYIRLNRPKSPVVCGSNYKFVLGRAATMKPGIDITIIATGLMVAKAIEAANRLKGQISCRVLNMSTLKPLDEDAIIQAAMETGAIVTAEEHLEHGGLGSMVASVVAKHRPVPMDLVAIKDTYAKSGKPDELLEAHGLSTAAIEEAVTSVVARK